MSKAKERENMATENGNPTPKTTQKKAPVQRKVVSASTGKEVTGKQTAPAAAPATGDRKGRARPLRIAAAVLWLLAILAEVAAILMLNKTIYIPEGGMTTWLLVALAVDLVLVIIASQCWKKANHMDPASKVNKLKFWLWNNLGVIISVIAFLPILILLLNNKDLDAKSKRLVSIVAAVALALGVTTSYDWNPASQEAMADAEEQAATISDGQVYWTTFGRRYHLYGQEDNLCSSLTRSSTLFVGTAQEAFEAGRTSACQFCLAKAEEEGVAVPGVEGGVVPEVEGVADVEPEVDAESEADVPADGETEPEAEPEIEPEVEGEEEPAA
jgi:hypothetical protein